MMKVSLQIKCAFTEFCQGKTMRWGVAWTFSPTMNLLDAEPSLLKLKQEEKRLHKPVAFKLQVRDIREIFRAKKLGASNAKCPLNFIRFQPVMIARPRSSGYQNG